MIEIKAPDQILKIPALKIFLAGSIEMGTSVDWQRRVVASCFDDNVIFLNPRRDDWDSSWKQTIKDTQFHKQVSWELDGLESADIIVMYIDPKTKSPITLLEFGQYYRSGKLIIACPHGFYRRGNLEVCCSRANLVLLESLEALIKTLKLSIVNLS